MRTFMAKPAEALPQRKWWIVDATNQPLGRLASRVATVLRGKHKAQFTPHVDTGDFVVVINADKVKLTGNKATDKMYYSHSGYPGGIKEISFEHLAAKHPNQPIEKAVKGMLPKNTLGRKMLSKLKVYAGGQHPHQAQQPATLEL
jgi:large subunit ribosomal protein L13